MLFFSSRVCTAWFLVSQGRLYRPLTLPDARHAAIVPAVQSQYKLSQQHFGGKIHIATQCSFFAPLSSPSIF